MITFAKDNGINLLDVRALLDLVVYGGYAAFDSSPPAIMFVVPPAKMIVAPQIDQGEPVPDRAGL